MEASPALQPARTAWEQILKDLDGCAAFPDVEVLKSSVRFERGVVWLSVTIDRPQGVDTGFCEIVSRYIAGQADRLDAPVPPYQIEVSSAGLERPLLVPEHFARFAGRDAKIVTTLRIANRTDFTGRIAAADERAVRLEDRYAGPTDIPYAAIKRATLVYEPAEDFRRSKHG
ncbi:MAG: ribosome maturation factor RimP [Candidatus Eremiobacteraeota bacterium]|nr:ribosome maturation factor RimP [Candidatus Eremiobacteraeota bacterium]